MFSCEFCEICKNPFFAEHHRATAAYNSSINSSEGRIGKRNCVNYETKAKAYVMKQSPRGVREIVFLEISQNSQENTWACL